MRKLLALAFASVAVFPLHAQFTVAIPPTAGIIPHWRVVQGDSVLDNYYWMYDYFGKGPDSTKAVAYLVAENKYLDTVMEKSKKFQSDLFLEMKGRIKEKNEAAPYFDNGYYYYYRTDQGKQYFKFCRKKGSMDAKEEIVFDGDQMAVGHAYFSATDLTVSDDNKLLAFALDTVSRRQYIIRVKNLETGKIFKDVITNTTGNLCWANDNKTLFYTSKNPVTLLSNKIYRHLLGTDAKNDQLVYAEKDSSNYIGVFKSKNRKYIFIRSGATLSSEYKMIDASRPTDAFTVFAARMKDVLYDLAIMDNKFLILTNKDSAINFKLMECPLNNTSVAAWKEYIPVRNDVLLENVEEFKNFIVLQERKDGLIRMRVISMKDNNAYSIDFGEATYYASFGQNREFNSSIFQYLYNSLTTPGSTYNYNLVSKEKKLIKRQVVLGGYNPGDYTTERLYATAGDGTKIPISLVYKKGFKKDGRAPLLLYGYGSYGFSMDASFSSTRLSFLNRGFVYAIAHVRGGQEMGRYWYLTGKLMKKKNTFTDFIDCGEFLVKEKYTDSAHLYAMGGSAGGLLMGAITNIAPGLWHGVVAQVPFVDVVNTMLDENIPLTTNEYDEWGNPHEKQAYYYMKSYSPYENVERKNYPNLLVETGLHDSQVQYFEPEKWVAKLRAMKTDNNILLLHTNLDYGHGGASGRFDYLKQVALEDVFLFSLEGIYK
ncbi:MAG TPA: S9 family peptidase [Puia sp.]